MNTLDSIIERWGTDKGLSDAFRASLAALEPSLAIQDIDYLSRRLRGVKTALRTRIEDLRALSEGLIIPEGQGRELRMLLVAEEEIFSSVLEYLETGYLPSLYGE